MNATEARELTTESQKESVDNGNRIWDMLKAVIFFKIKSAAQSGKSSVVIDLNTVEMAGANQNMSVISDNLKREGYKVDFMLTRTPDGSRSVTIEW